MRSLVDAIHEKYLDEDDDFSDIGIVLFVPKSLQKHKLPCVLVLDHCGINSLGKEDCIKTQCADVQELHLAHNNISHWDEVHMLLRNLKNVTFLNLSFNPLGNIKLPETSSIYPSLRQLILNGVGIQWNNFGKLLQMIPNLQELHLSFNKMHVPVWKDDNPVFEKITTLHYDGNNVEHRDHLYWISQTFPSLSSLVLSECPLWTLRWSSSALGELKSVSKLSEVSYGSAESGITGTCAGDGKSSPCCVSPEDCLSEQNTVESLFSHLRSVSLSQCPIECWEDLIQLRFWPSLTDLRMQSCPLFQHLTEHERRQLIIARLPNIRRLNGGSDISQREREQAERNFIRRFQNSELRPSRYTELLQIHGEVQPFADVKLAPQRSVDVWIQYGEQRWQEKNVSVYLTVKEFKERVCYKIGRPPSKLRFFFLGSEPISAEVMRFPSKRLYTYNIKDDHEIQVDDKL
nr:EOG090X05JJ [Cyclestheria hislopi]